MLAIRLDPKIEKRLERLAKTTGRTKTYYAREAILAHLDELELSQSPRLPRSVRETPPSGTVALPDFMARLKETYGDRILPDSQPIMDELRAERF